MKIFYTVLLALFVIPLIAQTHTFTGVGGSTSWHTAANWSANSVPTNASDVLIPDGFEVDVTSSAAAQTLSLTGSGTLNLKANISVTETFGIESVALLNYEKGNLSASTLNNNGTIRFLSNQIKTLTTIVLNNNSQMEFVDSNTINLSGTVVINNMSGGVMDILANGALSRQNGAVATLINDGIIRKYTENGDFGNFYMILDVVNNNILDVKEDNQLLFLSPQASLHNTSTGILSGTGVFDITSSFINQGTVSPGGDEVGTLTFINTFILEDGTLLLDIEGPDNHDKIDAFSTGALSGLIAVQSLENSDLEDVFSIITTGFFIESCSFPSEFDYDDGTGLLATFGVQCDDVELAIKLNSLKLIGFDEYKDLNFSITPNPINQEATIVINVSLLQSTQLNIYSISGEKVRTVSIDSENTTFNRDSLADGMYFAQLVSEGKVIATEKMIIK